MPIFLGAVAFSAVAAQGETEESVPRKAWLRAKEAHLRKKPPPRGPALWIGRPTKGIVVGQGEVGVSGCTEPGSRVTVNGKALDVYSTGAFASAVPLKVGRNRVVVRSTRNGYTTEKEIEVQRLKPPRVLPRTPLSILADGPMEPAENVELPSGAVLRVRCQASPGARAWFQIGARGERRPMRELTAEEDGVVVAGLYEGFYTIRPADSFRRSRIRVSVEAEQPPVGGADEEGARPVSARVPGRVTTVGEESTRVARILRSDTPIRETPHSTRRLISVPRGTRLEILGRHGRMFGVRLGETQVGWVDGGAIRFLYPPGRTPRRESDSSARPTFIGAELGEVKLAPDPESGDPVLSMSVDLGRPWPHGFALPVRVEAAENGSTLTLTVWGLAGQTPPAIDAAATTQTLSSQWSALRGAFAKDDVIRQLRAERPDARTLVLRLSLSHDRVWGFQSSFDDGALKLRIRRPPRLSSEGGDSLKGVKIALDAGHGGADTGAVGPGGLCESDINLAIAQRVSHLLRNAGAEVVLLRETDSQLSLDARVGRVASSGADLFVSIHNNSVSQSSDPMKTRGTRLFYYHGHGRKLAECILTSALRETGEGNCASTIQRHRFRPVRCCTQMPAALVECLFLSHPEDEMLLLNPAFLDRISTGVYKGITAYLQPDRVEDACPLATEELKEEETETRSPEETPGKPAVPVKKAPRMKVFH
ncbi:MAG TPA: N-acetylmuramoyl-L-alanine amidase [Sumerlaeia bacterium]|nr:N-acetylmuramoyl-L-alanine amidase [Sumerlaeia bacterium]